MLPSLALAASFQLTSSQTSVTTGQTVTVQVIATPGSSAIYTASAHLSFTPGVLQVTNFTFATNWMPVTQSSYNSTDNTGGALVKTGGYPGGFTAPTALGTITFTAVAPGTATVSATNASVLLDQNNTNEVSGTQGSLSITVTAPKPATTPTTASTTKKTTVATTQSSNTNTAAVNSSSSTNDNVFTSDQTAAVAAPEVAATNNSASNQAAAAGLAGVAWYWWLVLVLIILGGGYWYWARRR